MNSTVIVVSKTTSVETKKKKKFSEPTFLNEPECTLGLIRLNQLNENTVCVEC